jgi:REP element-mobilizing transposase RayT
MARPLRIQYEGAVYHVTCRGNERKDIFKDDADRQRFLRILNQAVNIYSVKLSSYILMTNHFHLLLETPLGNLSEFMRNFNITYTGYFNRRHKRVGHLYQGRYTGILVDRDAYLSVLSRYIHMNPIRLKAHEKTPLKEKIRLLKAYPWSSLSGYLNRKKKEPFVDYGLVLGEYGGDTDKARKAYAKALYAEMDKAFDLRHEVVAGSVIGGTAFLDWVKEHFLETSKDRERPSVKGIQAHVGKESILKAVERETGKDLGTLRRERGPFRQLAMEILYKAGGLTGPEIGALFGIDYSAVSQERKRFREKMGEDRKLKALYDRLVGKLLTVKI